MKTLLKKFLRNDSGAALVEYGVALLVVIIVGGVAWSLLGGKQPDEFTTPATGAMVGVPRRMIPLSQHAGHPAQSCG
jgi:Flp pilus assembly pilin Flp